MLVLKNWGERKPTCVVFLDIKKAYNWVNRRKLIERRGESRESSSLAGAGYKELECVGSSSRQRP